MTAQKAREMGDWLLKLLVPLFIAICSFALESVRSELRELRSEVKQMRGEYMAQIGQMAVKLARIEATEELRHDPSNRDTRAAD